MAEYYWCRSDPRWVEYDPNTGHSTDVTYPLTLTSEDTLEICATKLPFLPHGSDSFLGEDVWTSVLTPNSNMVLNSQEDWFNWQGTGWVDLPHSVPNGFTGYTRTMSRGSVSAEQPLHLFQGNRISSNYFDNNRSASSSVNAQTSPGDDQTFPKVVLDAFNYPNDMPSVGQVFELTHDSTTLNGAPVATLQVSTTAPTNEQGFWFNPTTGQLKVWTE